ncbi:hypothetical protein [Leadbetterella byssophila]|uniref:hypothetical protein n=1 Tax=Leadbetterella byssophila TaxID=316068 RepID=UPI00399F0468
MSKNLPKEIDNFQDLVQFKAGLLVKGCILLIFLISSCTSDEPKGPGPERYYPLGKRVYLYPGIVATEFVSSIDTFSNIQSIPITGLVHHEANESVVAQFTIGDKTSFATKGEDVAMVDYFPITTTYIAPIKDRKVGDVVSFVATINGESFQAEDRVISSKIEECDILSVKWGEYVGNVKNKELKRLIGANVEQVSSYLVTSPKAHWCSDQYDGITNFRFEYNKLIAVEEVAFITQSNRAAVLADLNKRVKKLGSTSTIVMLQDFSLRQPYEWTKGNLQFKVFSKLDNGRQVVGIEYTEKK